MDNSRGLTIRRSSSIEASSSRDSSLPSPKSEEEILEALKDETSLLTPRIRQPQEKWNRELFLKIVGVAKFVNKAKALRSNRTVTFDAASDDPLTPSGRSLDAQQRTLLSHQLNGSTSMQMNGNGVTSIKITQLEPMDSNEDASQSGETNQYEANSNNSSMQGFKTTSSSSTSIYSSSSEVSSPRDAQMVIFQETHEEAPLVIYQEEDSLSVDLTMKKVMFSCESETNISISATEKRKIARKWNYVKAIIGDIQEALRENPNSIETANLIQESAHELQHVMIGMEVSIAGLISMLQKIGSEIKNQNSDRERVKRERSLKITNELSAMNDSYEQYKETAKQCKKAVELHENKLERVIKRRQSHDMKILDQLDKIEKIKIELAAAAEELENLESDRYDFLQEEDECKDQASVTKSEWGEVMKKMDVMRDNIHRIDFQLENLNEEIDHEFDEQKKEMLDLIDQLLDLEVS